MLHKLLGGNVTERPAPGHEVSAGGRRFPVDVARHPRACRYVVRLSAQGRVRLTVPYRASIAGGLRFAARQQEWILREWTRLEARASDWTTGSTIWFRGERLCLIVDAGTVVIGGGLHRVPFKTGSVRAIVEANLRALATRELQPRTRELAREHGVTITSVSVRNQRSRWGSCSTRGTIALNWRLIQMPAHVSDYVILHELSHRKQPNHSLRFWRVVETLCPTWRESERWLRKFGKELL